MTEYDIVSGLVLEEEALTIEELAHACGTDREWVVERVATGVLTCLTHEPAPRFTSRDLLRARRVRRLECEFEADPDLAALVADLVDERDRLRARLRRAGLPWD